MFDLLDAASTAEAPVRTSWMRARAPKLPPGRHVALAPGVLLFHPHQVIALSALDRNSELPPPEVEPTGRSLQAPDWHRWALCAGMDQEVYFSEDRRARVTLAKKAKEICRGCPVAAECLTWALEGAEEFGIWAGTSGRTRAGMQDRIAAGESTVVGEVESWLRTRKPA